MGSRGHLRGSAAKKPCWIILGPKGSWELAFKQGGIWGVKPLLYPEWKALDRGDRLFFYATAPISGVIGTGRFDSRFIQDKPLWPDEMSLRKVLYPYRFQFQIDYVIEPNNWKSDGVKIALTIQEMRRGVNLLYERTADNLKESFSKKFRCRFSDQDQQTTMPLPKATPASPRSVSAPSHSQLQDMVFQIGQMNRLISEKEYPMESERLDVVWRRVEKSAPTYAFEVQVGGDIYHALGKLKHAFDLWNSNIFLVRTSEDRQRADSLLNGTFREIQERVKQLTTEKVRELYEQKRRWVDIEKEIGLL